MSEYSPRGAAGEPRSPVAKLGPLLMAAALVVVVATFPQLPQRPGHDRGGVALAAKPDGEKKARERPPRCEPHGRTLRRRLDTRRKVVALTFDDGPTPTTNAILRTLDRFRARATFFVVGRQVPAHEAVVERAARRGHAIGNHSFDHADLAAAGRPAKDQIRSTTSLIKQATGTGPCVFRPPYGSRTRALDRIVRGERMLSVLWNVDSADYTGAVPDQIQRNVLDTLERGSVVLMHDGGGDELNTLAALPGILRTLKRRGFETVTLPRLFGLERRR